ncbi:MAG: hypothetical protein ACXW4M_06500 [Anaerolineales bacterium]
MKRLIVILQSQLDETPKRDIQVIREVDIAVKTCMADVDILTCGRFDGSAQ